MKKKLLKKAETPLEKYVAEELNDMAEDYDSGVEGVLKDLFHGGCQSGMIGSLIYYTDTVKFYNKHREEIDKLLYKMCDETGMTPWQLFGDKWDKEDPLAREQYNPNLLAWYGFEETARELAYRNGLEV